MTETQAHAVLAALKATFAGGVRQHEEKGWQVWFGYVDGSLAVLSDDCLEVFPSWTDYYAGNAGETIHF